jgi:hypothetical protein
MDGLTFGGLDIASPAISAVDLSGLLHVPERVGENVPVPGRHGTVRAPGKTYGGRLAPFEVQITGRRPDGTRAPDPDVQLAENLRALGRVLALDAAPLVHTFGDGTSRQVLAECRAAVSAERGRSGHIVKGRLVFESHEAFWRAQAPTTAGPFTLAHNGVRLLAEFALSDAPIDDAVLTFGPGPAPTLVDVGTGAWVAYDAVIPAGRTLVLDVATHHGYGTGGLVFDRRLLRTSSSGGRWLVLTPTATAAPSVRLTHSGGAATMPVTVSARQAQVFG